MKNKEIKTECCEKCMCKVGGNHGGGGHSGLCCNHNCPCHKPKTENLEEEFSNFLNVCDNYYKKNISVSDWIKVQDIFKDFIKKEKQLSFQKGQEFQYDFEEKRRDKIIHNVKQEAYKEIFELLNEAVANSNNISEFFSAILKLKAKLKEKS